MKDTDYIPHSDVLEIRIAFDLSSSNMGDKILIITNTGTNYYTSDPFYTNSNGITGKFIEIT